MCIRDRLTGIRGATFHRCDALAARLGKAPDAEQRLAAAVLRVLHVNDMRALQTAVDALLVAMQERTGDPKTDVGAGKVGWG